MDEHSLQSPFLFQIYQKALNPSLRKKQSDECVESLRKGLSKDERSIVMNNFGSGSKLLVKNSKKISSIAKSGISERKQSEILVNLIEAQKSQYILELGTSLGLNAIYMSFADGVQKITTVEGNQELAEIARDNFKNAETANIELVLSDIDLFLTGTNDLYNFVYIDANHTYEAVRRYFSRALALISDHGIIVVDDINWSQGMRIAWQSLIKDYPDHLYIENDKMGIVFVKVKVEQNHYFLRF